MAIMNILRNVLTFKLLCIKLFCTKQIKLTGGNSDNQKACVASGEYKAASIKTPLFAALEAIMDVLLPTIMAFIIDQGIEKGDMNAIIRYGLLTFLVAAIALVLGVLAGKYAAEASTGFAGNLRDAMYENIQHYSFSNIDKFSTAGLVTRMTTDVTNVQNAFQMIERMCVRAPVHLVFAMFMAVVIGGPLSLVFVVAVAFLVAVLAAS